MLPAAAPVVASAPQPSPTSAPAAPTLAQPPDPERDSLAYLHFVHAQTQRLAQYTVLFTRHERRGLLGALHGPERIRCWFRRSPFSIRMKWIDDPKYGESTYVAGQFDDRVRFVPRHGFLGLPPMRVTVGLHTPVIWGEATHPVTDFGLERLMEQTLESLKDVEHPVQMAYMRDIELPGYPKRVHGIRMEYSPLDRRAPIHELLIDPGTHLPVQTVVRSADGQLDSSYRYDELNTNVTLTDEDFLLDVERSGNF